MKRSPIFHLPVGDFGEHVLRHDDGIFELFQHERIVAPIDACLVARFEPLVQLNHGRGGLHELVDNVRTELVGNWKGVKRNSKLN